MTFFYNCLLKIKENKYIIVTYEKIKMKIKVKGQRYERTFKSF